MKFVSTRGQAPEVGFVDALLAGLAPDGGLYTPKHWPALTAAEIAAFAGRPYSEVAADILSRFAEGEIDDQEYTSRLAVLRGKPSMSSGPQDMPT